MQLAPRKARSSSPVTSPAPLPHRPWQPPESPPPRMASATPLHTMQREEPPLRPTQPAPETPETSFEEMAHGPNSQFRLPGTPPIRTANSISFEDPTRTYIAH